jgi:hypothetical protein
MHIFAHFTLWSKCCAAVCSIVLAIYRSQRQLQFYKGFINSVDIKVEPGKKNLYNKSIFLNVEGIIAYRHKYAYTN